MRISYTLVRVPRSHICPSCLFELGSIRAIPDPHYGLGIVVCPRCSLACERAKHPDQVFWKSFNRVRQALGFIVLKMFMSLIIGLILTGLTHTFFETFLRSHRKVAFFDPLSAHDPTELALAWMCVLFPILTGLFARPIFHHLPKLIAGLILLSFGLFILSAEYMFGRVILFLELIAQFDSGQRFISNRAYFDELQAFGIVAILFCLGLYPGQFLSNAIQSSWAKRGRKKRKKLRKRQRHAS